MTEKKDKRSTPVDFFHDVLVPLAEAARREGKLFFSLRQDPQANTYYVEPTRRVMTRADFELRAAESVEDFVKELAALWTAEGYDELAEMAPHLLELVVADAEQDNEEDVSPLIYAMY